MNQGRMDLHSKSSSAPINESKPFIGHCRTSTYLTAVCSSLSAMTVKTREPSCLQSSQKCRKRGRLVVVVVVVVVYSRRHHHPHGDPS